MKNTKLILGVAAALVLSVAGTGCGSKTTTTTTTGGTSGSSGNPKIVVVNGTEGYYVNNQFCDAANNYCGSGKAYGITAPPSSW